MSILTVFIIALLVSALFSSPYRRNGSWVQLVVFFFILFLAGIAGGYWIVPVGPVMWGVSWLPLLSVIFVVAILFSAQPPHQHTMARSSEKTEMGTLATVGIFTWILFVVLLIAVLAGVYK